MQQITKKLSKTEPDSGWLKLEGAAHKVQVQLGGLGTTYSIFVSLDEPDDEFRPSALVDQSSTGGIYSLKDFAYVRFKLVQGEKALFTVKECA